VLGPLDAAFPVIYRLVPHEPKRTSKDKCTVCPSCFLCSGYSGMCRTLRSRTSEESRRMAGMKCGCGSGTPGCAMCGHCVRCCATVTSCFGFLKRSTAVPTTEEVQTSHVLVDGECVVCPSCHYCSGYGPGCFAYDTSPQPDMAGTLCKCNYHYGGPGVINRAFCRSCTKCASCCSAVPVCIGR